MGGKGGHPFTWRLHRAHPALGLEETEHEVLVPCAPHDLGVRWLALAPAERRQREADLLDALRSAAERPDGFELELVHDRRLGTLGVWTDRWKAPALQRELLDHVWSEAERRRERDTTAPELRRRREIDRTLRAHAQIVWSRHGFRIVLGTLWLAALLGWLPLGYTHVTDVAVLVAIAAVMTLAVGGVVRRWYRRVRRVWGSRG